MNLKKVVTTKKIKDLLAPSIPLIAVNLTIIVVQFIYLNLRIEFLNDQIPLWYTKPWGKPQLADKTSIFLIPTVLATILVLGIIFSAYARKTYLRYGTNIIFFVITYTSVILSYSIFRIVSIASTPTRPILNPYFLELLVPFVTSVLLVYFVTPRFIELAKDKNLITDPAKHTHPGMVLKMPSARGGGAVFTTALLTVTPLFVEMTKEIVTILMVTFVVTLVGLLDDYQNTHPKSKLRMLESPVLRLIALITVVSIIPLSGITIDFINNPLDGNLGFPTFLAIPLTVIWITWVLNLLSWSNGVDGQYSGMMGIAFIMVAALSLRFTEVEPMHLGWAKMAIIAAGASLGMLPHSWHPSKIMWGFGAIAAGIVLTSLSILNNSKIATSILILLVPFLDGAVTVVRRLIHKKSPFKGDQGHLHHILLRRGWTPQKIASFYILTTLVFGLIGILSAQRYTVLTVLTLSGLAASFIVLMNLKSQKQKVQLPQPG